MKKKSYKNIGISGYPFMDKETSDYYCMPEYWRWSGYLYPINPKRSKWLMRKLYISCE